MQNRKALYLLLSANIVSGMAQGISILAVPWYMSDVRGEASTYGFWYTIITFATLFWSLYAGTLIDRYPRKNVFLGLNTAGLLVMTGIGLTGHFMGSVPDVLVMLAFGTTIFIFNIHYPALYAFGQEITEKKHYGKINSLFEVQGQATSMLAGAFAALLLGGTTHDFPLKDYLPEIAAWDIHDIFLLDAATYAGALTLIALIRYQPQVLKKVDTSSLRERFRSGIQFLKNNKALFWFGIGSYAVFVTVIVQAFYLMANYVSNVLDDGAWLFAFGEVLYAAGALTAGLFIRFIFRKVHAVYAILLMMVVIAAGYFVVSTWPVNATFLGFNLFLGLCNAGIRVLRVTWLFNHVPNHLIGRTNSIFNANNILLRTVFLGLFSFPFFVNGTNVTYAYLILTGFIIIATLPILTNLKALVKMKEDN